MDKQIQLVYDIVKKHFSKIDKDYPGFLSVVERTPGIPNISRKSIKGGAPNRFIKREVFEYIEEAVLGTDFHELIVKNKATDAINMIQDLKLESVLSTDIENFVFYKISEIHGESIWKYLVGHMIMWLSISAGVSNPLVPQNLFDVLPEGLRLIGVNFKSFMANILNTLNSVESIKDKLGYELGLSEKKTNLMSSISEALYNTILNRDSESHSSEQLQNLYENFNYYIVIPFVILIVLSTLSNIAMRKRRPKVSIIQQVQQQNVQPVRQQQQNGGKIKKSKSKNQVK